MADLMTLLVDLYTFMHCIALSRWFTCGMDWHHHDHHHDAATRQTNTFPTTSPRVTCVSTNTVQYKLNSIYCFTFIDYLNRCVLLKEMANNRSPWKRHL
mmetsp:Transcript_1500/g.3324  ORF Transcript_1500/g.3324 Transcript_1500/m.3324 type:complete len:99 (-) Transcript_1500:990-1286(-)